MILIITALKAEAMPIIERLALKRIDAVFPTYANDDFVLVICGVGTEKCAAATGWAFGRFANIIGAINIGCAGYGDDAIDYGKLFVANIVEHESKSRAYVPDILYKHSLCECRLLTFDEEVRNYNAKAENTLFDMEAYGFVSAAFCFLTNDKCACLKYPVDDVHKNISVSKEELCKLSESVADDVIGFVFNFKAYCEACSKTEQEDILTNVIDTVSNRYSLTESRRNILKKELHNTHVYYNTVPDLNLLPELQGTQKKHSAAAFKELLGNMRNNINCIDCPKREQETDLSRSCFRHIYVEREILDTEYVQSVISKFKNANIVPVPDYKSVFNRKKQNALNQLQNKNLILAKAHGALLYKGSDYCNAFGFEKFYYCSTVMGCIYGCRYCYLQGMYSSSNIVAFVNTEDFFEEINKVDDGTGFLVCCSYDSDILALDKILNTVEKWLDFAESKPNITFEIRTKSVGISSLLNRKPVENVIIAYTLSPESVRRKFELYTTSTSKRLSAAERLLQHGWRVRVCIEPVLAPVVNEKDYFALADEIIKSAATNQFEDIVVGEFRMNGKYFQQIASLHKECPLFANPYISYRGTAAFYDGSKECVLRISEHIRQKSGLKVICFQSDL